MTSKKFYLDFLNWRSILKIGLDLYVHVLYAILFDWDYLIFIYFLENWLRKIYKNWLAKRKYKFFHILHQNSLFNNFLSFHLFCSNLIWFNLQSWCKCVGISDRKINFDNIRKLIIIFIQIFNDIILKVKFREAYVSFCRTLLVICLSCNT